MARRRIRRWRDALGESWSVRLYPEGADHPETGEPLRWNLLHFDDGRETAAIHVRGESPEEVHDFEDAALDLALEVARDERGFVFADLEGNFWWVRRGSRDDRREGEYPIVFDDGTDERRHPWVLPQRAEDLSDDDIEELIDRARRVAA